MLACLMTTWPPWNFVAGEENTGLAQPLPHAQTFANTSSAASTPSAAVTALPVSSTPCSYWSSGATLPLRLITTLERGFSNSRHLHSKHLIEMLLHSCLWWPICSAACTESQTSRTYVVGTTCCQPSDKVHSSNKQSCGQHCHHKRLRQPSSCPSSIAASSYTRPRVISHPSQKSTARPPLPSPSHCTSSCSSCTQLQLCIKCCQVQGCIK